MSRRLLTLALLSLLTLPACSTTQPTPAQQASSPLKAVPCSEVPIIAYHIPKNATEIGAWLAGKEPDPSNLYDTPDTVQQVRKNNAARIAVCGQ